MPAQVSPEVLRPSAEVTPASLDATWTAGAKVLSQPAGSVEGAAGAPLAIDTRKGGEDPEWTVVPMAPGRGCRLRTTLYEADIKDRVRGAVQVREYRVRARNAIGWSEFSPVSSYFVLKLAEDPLTL